MRTRRMSDERLAEIERDYLKNDSIVEVYAWMDGLLQALKAERELVKKIANLPSEWRKPFMILDHRECADQLDGLLNPPDSTEEPPND